MGFFKRFFLFVIWLQGEGWRGVGEGLGRGLGRGWGRVREGFYFKNPV